MTHESTIPGDRLAAALRAAEPCPANERLAAAGMGELAAADLAAIERHAAACPSCSAELELVRGFDRVEGALSVEDRGSVDWIVSRLGGAPPVAQDAGRVLPFARRSAPGRFRPGLWGALAASVAVAAVGVTLLVAPAPPRVPELGGGDVTRGSELTIETALGEVAAVPARITWGSLSGAVSYRIRITSVDGTAVVERESSTAAIELDAEALAAVETLVRYRVSLEALDAAGTVVARAEPAELFVDPELR